MTGQEVNGELIRFSPKNKKTRFVDLPPFVVNALKAWKAQQNADRLVVGDAWHGDDFVFTRPDGRPLSASAITHAFARFADAARIECHLHDLRHVAATVMIRANVNPKTVCSKLGHHSVAFTYDTYGHLWPSMQRESAAALDAAFGGRA